MNWRETMLSMEKGDWFDITFDDMKPNAVIRKLRHYSRQRGLLFRSYIHDVMDEERVTRIYRVC